MSAASNPFAVMASPLTHHRFTLAEYEAMVEHGILTPGDRAELLAGEILEKMTIGSRHAACVSKLHGLFTAALGVLAQIRTQSPLALPPDSEPEPDVALVRPRDDFYATAHPRSEDTFLVVEIADSSLWIDRTVKLPLYAAAGIPEYWIVDFASNVVEVYRNPEGDRYTSRCDARGDEVIALQAFPDVAVRVADIII